MALKKIFIISTLLAINMTNAQDGTNIYTFLNVPVSARQAALGGNTISLLDDDVSTVIINPSLMNLSMNNQLAINYASHLAGSSYGAISYVKDLKYGHLFTLNARYMGYGDIPRTDETGHTNGNFSANDVAIGAGYAYQFEDNWTIGGGLHFISSKIDNYTSMAIAGTGAITYYTDDEKRTSISLVARNFGYQFRTYNGIRERLPFRVDLGYTKILDNFPLALTITAHDLQKFNISQEYDRDGKKVSFMRKIADHFSIGGELFPAKSFNIRMGYNVKRGNELSISDQRSFAGLSFGFGIRISSFRIDYTHARYHSASNTNLLGITLNLNEISSRTR